MNLPIIEKLRLTRSEESKTKNLCAVKKDSAVAFIALQLCQSGEAHPSLSLSHSLFSNFSFVYFVPFFLYVFGVRLEEGVGSLPNIGGASETRAMKLLINGGVDMKYRTLTYRVSVMYS